MPDYDDDDDDRDRDRDRDRRRYEDDDDEPRRPRRGGGAGSIKAAKAHTIVPAVFLIIVGLISLGSVGYGFVMLPQFDENIQAEIKKVENNPAIPAQQKQAQIDLIQKIADTIKPLLMPMYVLAGIVGVLTVLGGILFMNLKAKWLVVLSSILSMLPFTSGCCCVGLPIGIWVIVALNNPIVRDGYEAVSRKSSPADEDYD